MNVSWSCGRVGCAEGRLSPQGCLGGFVQDGTQLASKCAMRLLRVWIHILFFKS